MCSTVRRVVVRSYSRGTIATATPSSSQRRTSRSSTSFGARREGDDHLLDVVLAERPRRDPSSPRARTGRRPPASASGSLSRKPIGFRPSSGDLEQALRGQPPDLARADDQRRAQILAGPPCLHARPVERDPPRGDIRRRERPETYDLVDRSLPSPDDGCEREKRHCGEARRGGDLPDVVDRAQPERGCVQASEGHQRHHDDPEGARPQWRSGPDTCRLGAERRRERREDEHAGVDCHADDRPRNRRPQPKAEVPALVRRL